MAQLAGAQDTQAPLLFQTWKEQQILEAQNGVLRANVKLDRAKSGRGNSGSSVSSVATEGVSSDKIKRVGDVDPVVAAEKELSRAQESLRAANDLQFKDYVEVYIPSLQDQPESLQRLAEKLSKEELAEIFKGLMQKSSPGDAKRNSNLMEGLRVSSRAKSP